MEKGALLVRKVLMHHMSIPALNKWTTVAPCASFVAAQQHFCGVLPAAFEACFGNLPEASESSQEDQGAALGQPIDQTRRWRKLARRRQKKAVMFLKDPESQFRTLSWTVLTAPVMRIHYSLFKHAHWFTERPAVPPDESSAFGMVAARPTRRALAVFADMMQSTENESWLPLVGFYGPVLQWPQARLRTTRRTVCTIVGQLWRKLDEPWQQYPWKLLGLLADDERRRQACAEELLASRKCCLDNFSEKLRAMCPSAEQLLSAKTATFLEAVFNRVVPTSTDIERCFARYQRWTATRGHKLKASQLAARHYAQCMTHLVDQWRRRRIRAGLQAAPRTHRHRPVWIRGARSQRASTGLHAFTRAQRHLGAPARGNQGWSSIGVASRAWSRLPPEERARWRQQARLQNAAARAQLAQAEEAEGAESFVGGPWDMGSSAGFPLARHVVVDNQPRQAEMAQQFEERAQQLQPENLDSMSGAPQAKQNLFAPCGSGACFGNLPEGRPRADAENLHSLLIHAIMKKGPGPLKMTEEPLVVAFLSEVAERAEYYVVAYNTRKPPIEAAMLKVEVDMNEELPEGVSKSLRMSAAPDGQQFVFFTNKSLCVRLLQVASDWTLYTLQVGPVRKLWHFDIVGAEKVDTEAAKRDLDSSRSAAVALQALRELLKPRQPPKRRDPGAFPKPSKKRAKKAAADPEAEEKRHEVAEDEEEASSQGSSRSDVAAGFCDPTARSSAEIEATQLH